MIKKILLFGLIFFQIQQISAQNLKNLSIILHQVPLNLNSSSGFYLAGDFNNWNPADANAQFKLNEKGQWKLNFSLSSGLVNFKVTKGSWEKVETNGKGESISNRFIQLKNDTTIVIKIAGFKDQYIQQPKKSTRSKQVQILDSVFRIPPLILKRRIWIYLPKSYQTTSKNYPVIYMQDGQNLFDQLTAGYGEWGVDEILDSLSISNKPEAIIVGIDHGGATRLTEYNPFNHNKFGKGSGDDYVDFIVKTLKPYIDKHFKTLNSKKHTSIAGSSMGALISMYAIAKYPSVFGKAGIFSPAFWVAPQLYNYILNRPLKKSKIYFVAGDLESEEIIPDMKRMYDLLIDKGISPTHLKFTTKANGKHNEEFWHSEFPAFYQWLINQ